MFASAVILGSSALRARAWETRLESATPAEKLRVALIQPNINQMDKMDSYMHPDPRVKARMSERIYRAQETLVLDFLPEGIDLVVMPESAYPSLTFVEKRDIHRRIEELMKPSGADLLFGAARLVRGGPGERVRLYNSALYLEQGGSVEKAPYQDKMLLVPFGETIPYFDAIPFVKTLVGVGEWDIGEEIGIFETRGYKFGAMICFESAFGAQGRRIANEGASFLAVITNDAWYGFSAGPPQHHNLSLLRAVETRRPVVRAANTGISSIINPAGRVTDSLGLGAPGVIPGEIVPQSVTTFFARWGNLWLILAAILTLLHPRIARLVGR